jgi:hypothetical protein
VHRDLWNIGGHLFNALVSFSGSMSKSIYAGFKNPPRHPQIAASNSEHDFFGQGPASEPSTPSMPADRGSLS